MVIVMRSTLARSTRCPPTKGLSQAPSRGYSQRFWFTDSSARRRPTETLVEQTVAENKCRAPFAFSQLEPENREMYAVQEQVGREPPRSSQHRLERVLETRPRPPSLHTKRRPRSGRPPNRAEGRPATMWAEGEAAAGARRTGILNGEAAGEDCEAIAVPLCCRNSLRLALGLDGPVAPCESQCRKPICHGM